MGFDSYNWEEHKRGLLHCGSKTQAFLGAKKLVALL